MRKKIFLESSFTEFFRHVWENVKFDANEAEQNFVTEFLRKLKIYFWNDPDSLILSFLILYSGQSVT